MSIPESVWETFDALFKTVARQGRLVEELEGRVVELERRLQEREGQAGASAGDEKPSHLQLVEVSK